MANKKGQDKTYKKPLIITIASAKGGNGKTTIAINMAKYYSQLGKNVLVIDSIIGYSNVNLFVNEIPEYNLYHVLKHHNKISDIITKSKYGFSYVSSPCGLPSINLNDKDYLNIINGIKSIKNFDIIIIDTATGITKYILELINIADEKIIVISPDFLDISNAYGFLKILTENYRDIKNLSILSNRIKIGDEDRMKKIVKNMNKTMKKYFEYTIPIKYLGYIYYSPLKDELDENRKLIIKRKNIKLCFENIIKNIGKRNI